MPTSSALIGKVFTAQHHRFEHLLATELSQIDVGG